MHARTAITRMSRRSVVFGGVATLAGGTLAQRAVFAQPHDHGAAHPPQTPSATTAGTPGEQGRDYTPVVVPNGWTLPFDLIDGVKVFHLVAEEVPDHEFVPPQQGTTGLRAHCWGFNGSIHGPLIEAVEGDRVRIFVTNRLQTHTSVHWHGLILPSGMDGVGGLSQSPIPPGETYVYEFTLRQHGTFMYHSHHDEMTQMGMGMTGLFVVHPRNPTGPRPDRDFALLLHEWAIEPGTRRPDPNEMTDFNLLTINGRAFPGTFPLIVRLGDRVRIRIGNLSAMDHHPIHLHGYSFRITETDGGSIPPSAQWPENTVLVSVGQTRTIEFVADNPGDWALHCHMTHHVMNQMGHEFPNMIGVDAGGVDRQIRPLLPQYMTMGQQGMGDMGPHIESGHMHVPANSVPMIGSAGPHGYITMGGMFTVLKVREALPAGYDTDPGWYQSKPGEIAERAPEDVLRRNRISHDGAAAPRPPRKAQLPQATTKPADHGSHGGHEGHGGR
jgi:manganese oxidase